MYLSTVLSIMERITADGHVGGVYLSSGPPGTGNNMTTRFIISNGMVVDEFITTKIHYETHTVLQQMNLKGAQGSLRGFCFDVIHHQSAGLCHETNNQH